MHLGTCYYPEHWPEARWAIDAALMVETGITRVRIGEFAWSRIEPARGDFRWDWLDRAVETLGEAGLEIILCTPTATPPKWLVDKDPSILPVDREGRVRGWGSRRHYDFSSARYREESRRITRAVAERYGEHASVVGWQTDNEYGCHDSVRSYSRAARDAFRAWLADRYDTPDALNAAWGNVFWSMEVSDFGQVELPNLTVTEANPAHWLDFCRFSSDQVISFDAEQVAILRELSPGRFVCHNVMGISTDFDNFALGRQHDMLAWDSYPLGFLEQSAASDAHKTAYMRAGDPDFQAFHHDLYRNCSRDWGVMEQQNGPVNWAPHNPVPRDRMVALWSEEAIAHGADLVSWFRWRQCPFAQEQTHSGLLSADGEPARGLVEAREVEPRDVGAPIKQVALVFSYEAKWMLDIQPQGQGFDYWELVQTLYQAARRMGLNIDVVAPDADLRDYALVVVPSLPILSELRTAPGQRVLFGPRTGSRTESFHLVMDDVLGARLPLRVARSESLRPGARIDLDWRGHSYTVGTWREELESDVEGTRGLCGNWTSLIQDGATTYLGVWPSADLARDLIQDLAQDAGLETVHLPDGVRLRHVEGGRFVCNYSDHVADVEGHRLEPSQTLWLQDG